MAWWVMGDGDGDGSVFGGIGVGVPRFGEGREGTEGDGGSLRERISHISPTELQHAIAAIAATDTVRYHAVYLL